MDSGYVSLSKQNFSFDYTVVTPCLQTNEDTLISLCSKNHPERKLANVSSFTNHPDRKLANMSSCANHLKTKPAIQKGS